MIDEELHRIGFTPGEVRVYRALLSLGTSSAGKIAVDANVARSKLYNILERLSKRGLVSIMTRNGVRQYSVAKPSRLLDFLRKRREEFEEESSRIAEFLPQLESEFALHEQSQGTQVFEGLEGLKNVREEVLSFMQSGESAYFLGVPSSAYDRMEGYYRDWNIRRIRKGIRSWTLFSEDAKSNTYVKKKKREALTQVRFLPKKLHTFTWMEIYGNIVVVATNYAKPMSIVIRNKYVAQSYKSYFNFLWGLSERN